MKTKTDELLLSAKYTEKEKQHFALHTIVYEYSTKFWNTNKHKSNWKVYAAAAIGGLLGLY
jgi:hypothetical protein